MQPIAINEQKSLILVKSQGRVLVISYDKQFKNDYFNALASMRLHGVGVLPDGKNRKICRCLSDVELRWLSGVDLVQMVRILSR